jgi:hypothetical protein
MTVLSDMHVREDGSAAGGIQLMRDLSAQIPASDLRIWKKRGVYKTMATRRGVRGAAPGEYSVNVPKLSDTEVAEI